MTSGNMLSSDELCVMLRRWWPLESGCKMQSAFLVQNELSKYELPNCSHLIRFLDVYQQIRTCSQNLNFSIKSSLAELCQRPMTASLSGSTHRVTPY